MKWVAVVLSCSLWMTASSAGGGTITSTIDPGPPGANLFKTAIFDLSTDLDGVRANGENLIWKINILKPKHLDFERFEQETLNVQAMLAFDGPVSQSGYIAARLKDPETPDVMANRTFFIPWTQENILANAEWDVDQVRFHSIEFRFPLPVSQGSQEAKVFSAGIFLFGNDLNFSVGQWEAVPEPSLAMALLSLTGMALWGSTRRRRSSFSV